MSNAGTSQQAPRGGGALTVLRTELGAMLPEIQNALPAHISKEKFGRVAMTAIQGNPELLEVDRRSVWKACLQAAQDGLLPDGKEGAIVVRWSPKGKMAAWQPMIAGVRKKAQNAGLISTWDVDAVYANDEFEYEKGDNPFIRHKPALTNRGALVAAYSIATLKDGSKSREIMGVDEIYEIRDNFSTAWQAFAAKKIKSTPWASSPGEMAKKTVGHRHAKVLPLSSDIRELLLKGDDLPTAAEALPPPEPNRARLSIAGQFDMIAGGDSSPANTDTIDNETGEIVSATTEPSDDRKSEPASGDLGRPDANDAGASTSSQTAPASTTKAEPAKGKAGADDKRAKAADLLAVGEKVAAREGYGGVKDWIEDLTGSEVALITPEFHDRWREVAKQAGKPVES